MRQAPNQKRPRGGRSSGRKGGGHGGNRTYESSGPSTKIRGNASQLFDKYQALARDAHSSGDRVAAENFFQHAEHYFRLLNQASGTQQPQRGQGQNNAQPAQAGQDARAPEGVPVNASPAVPADPGSEEQPEIEVAKVGGNGPEKVA
jgi:hypothetical protein